MDVVLETGSGWGTLSLGNITLLYLYKKRRFLCVCLSIGASVTKNHQSTGVIIKPIMDGIQIVMCLQKHVDILPKGLEGSPKKTW